MRTVSVKYIASCSFGKDSLALVLRLIEDNYPLDEVVYYNTGAEFKAIEENKDKIKVLLKAKNILFTELKPEKDFFFTMLEKPVTKRNGTKQNGYKWCGGLCRWGTTEKIRAINNNYRKYGSEVIIEYVGIAIDEQERIARERIKRQKDRIKLYPLAEWGMKEADCLRYCRERGFNWNENGVELYTILDRVSCWCCRNKNLKELENIYKYLPCYWEKLKVLQGKIEIPFKAGKTIFDLEERFKGE